MAWCQWTQLEMWWTTAPSGICQFSVCSWAVALKQSLLVGQVEEYLILGLVEDGKGINLTEWGSFHGGVSDFLKSWVSVPL